MVFFVNKTWELYKILISCIRSSKHFLQTSNFQILAVFHHFEKIAVVKFEITNPWRGSGPETEPGVKHRNFKRPSANAMPPTRWLFAKLQVFPYSFGVSYHITSQAFFTSNHITASSVNSCFLCLPFWHVSSSCWTHGTEFFEPIWFWTGLESKVHSSHHPSLPPVISASARYVDSSKGISWGPGALKEQHLIPVYQQISVPINTGSIKINITLSSFWNWNFSQQVCPWKWAESQRKLIQFQHIPTYSNHPFSGPFALGFREGSYTYRNPLLKSSTNLLTGIYKGILVGGFKPFETY